MDPIEARLAQLGLQLPEAATPAANYAPYLLTRDELIVSGQLPVSAGELAYKGIVGEQLSIAEGRAAARLCALNILAQAKAALGSLDRIGQCVRLNGFVTAGPDFADHSAVLNGASDLMVDLFGDKGRHTRIAVGVASLPLGAAVEIDAIFAVL